jgi:hypothetical protein
VNESLKIESKGRITDTTCYNILTRHDLVEAERRHQKKYKSFEWGHPDELIQGDLTSFNGYPIMTMEDNYSKKGWPKRLNGPATDDSVVYSMEQLHPGSYENLLTDNGKQFARMNSTMRKYCEAHLTGKHIWSSVHHPQTLGKLSNFQKGLKLFLRHRLGRSRDRKAIDECIEIYLIWYNYGKIVLTTGCCSEERYSRERDPRWYEKLVLCCTNMTLRCHPVCVSYECYFFFRSPR